ncbi:MAG: hypothetical protein IJZ45_02350 [Bacteroidaceae bacterium]|nr:hypothetical protein [Bacteroidaceae bacterium]
MKTKKMHLQMFALSVIILANLANATGQTLTKTFTFKFDPKDFTVEQIGTERKCEIFSNLNFGHGELGEPDLPHVTYNILLPDNYRVHSFTYSVGDDTCRINRIYFYPTAEAFLNNTPDTLTVDSIPLYPTPLTVSGPGPHPDAPQYPLETFPTKIEHVGARKLDDYRLEKFRICPFTYYAAEQKLVLSTSFNLTVSIIPYNNENPSHTGIQDERIKEITYNLEDFGKGTGNWMPNSIETDKRFRQKAIISKYVSSLHCTAPNAVKLEVYTMDAIKVGEARFVDGEATVKMGEAPAMYLYVVTYPDGRRESGKARVSEE